MLLPASTVILLFVRKWRQRWVWSMQEVNLSGCAILMRIMVLSWGAGSFQLLVRLWGRCCPRIPLGGFAGNDDAVSAFINCLPCA